MGQIPVKVKGIVLPEDYIIPSGNNDEIGIDISPNEILPNQYKYILGIAWSSVLIDTNSFSYVNMSIGLNSNVIAKLTEEHENRISNLEKNFKSLEKEF